MNSLRQLIERITFPKEVQETTIPGAFVNYIPVKKKSSGIELASTDGVIKKVKKRSPEKTIYEFLALDVWNEVFSRYSAVNDIKFRAPKPLGVCDLDTDSPTLLMEFMPGYELKNLIAKVKRNTPVSIYGQKQPLPLYPACMLHLGALDRIKEQEGLYHSDYDVRHVKFNFVKDVFMSVVDFENSREEPLETIKGESEIVYNQFIRSTSAAQRDIGAWHSWYQEGYNGLVLPGERQLPSVVKGIEQKYSIEFSFMNQMINGVRVNCN